MKDIQTKGRERFPASHDWKFSRKSGRRSSQKIRAAGVTQARKEMRKGDQ